MAQRFIQKSAFINTENSTGKIKVEKLCELINNHPYKEIFYEVFEIEKNKK